MLFGLQRVLSNFLLFWSCSCWFSREFSQELLRKNHWINQLEFFQTLFIISKIFLRISFRDSPERKSKILQASLSRDFCWKSVRDLFRTLFSLLEAVVSDFHIENTKQIPGWFAKEFFDEFPMKYRERILKSICGA